jgi:hypothetical protein
MNPKAKSDLSMREMMQLISLLLLDEDHQAWFQNLTLGLNEKPHKRRADLASGDEEIRRFLQEGWHERDDDGT